MHRRRSAERADGAILFVVMHGHAAARRRRCVTDANRPPRHRVRRHVRQGNRPRDLAKQRQDREQAAEQPQTGSGDA